MGSKLFTLAFGRGEESQVVVNINNPSNRKAERKELLCFPGQFGTLIQKPYNNGLLRWLNWGRELGAHSIKA